MKNRRRRTRQRDRLGGQTLDKNKVTQKIQKVKMQHQVVDHRNLRVLLAQLVQATDHQSNLLENQHEKVKDLQNCSKVMKRIMLRQVQVM